MVIKRLRNKGDYRKGYLELKRDAGEKPKANYRKPRQKPCTQQVCLLLSEVPYFFRKDLRQRLKEMEYTVNIARALKRLIEQGKIRTEGSANSPKQRIYLAK